MQDILLHWRDYLSLTKPKVVLLMLLTAYVGMQLASSGWVVPGIFFFALLGIGLTGGAAAAINHIVDRHIDAKMARTERRPIATGRVSPKQAIVFSVVLASVGLAILVNFVNLLTAILTLLTLVGYAFVYTLFLKRTTPQNIVIGGLAGAAPPLLGWTAVTGQIDAFPLLLVLIIFTWTPPHFWALAIYRYEDYRKVKIPMLPVTHGINFTVLCILLYTILLFIVSLLPFLTGMSSWLYLVGAVTLGLGFLYMSLKLMLFKDGQTALKTFRYSIIYLMLLFVFLLLDHVVF